MSRSIHSLVRELQEFAGAGGDGIGNWSFPGPEVGNNASAQKAPGPEVDQGAKEREKSRRLKRRKDRANVVQGKYGKPIPGAHPDDTE